MNPLLRSAPALAICVLSTGIAVAAPDPSTASVNQVIVTATRHEQPLERVAVDATVIEASAVRSSQKTAVSDLLATTAGVAVSRNGGLGTTTSLRIRGAEADHTVVLIDGVKLNDPSSTGGGYNFANLLNSEVSRIEVLRGSQSTLWGSQAIGGVVNIVSSLPQGPLAFHASAEGGSRDTLDFSARAEAGSDRFSWRLGGNYLTTDGVSAFDENLGGREDDGFRSVGWNARGALQLTDAICAELRSNWSKGTADFDGFLATPPFSFGDSREYGYTEELVSYAGLNVAALGNRLHNRIGFAYTDTDHENYDPTSTVPVTFDSSGRNRRWEYQGTLQVTDAIQSVFGLESERSELRTASPSIFNPRPVPLDRSVRIDSVYFQAQVSPVEAMTLSAGVRHDDHDTFGGNTTAQTGVAWAVTDSTLLCANYGEGFKAPTLFQLFSEYGNTDLQPESAKSWDAGVEQRLLGGAVTASAVYFERDTDNMIDFVSCFAVASARCSVQPDGYYDNIQKATADGVELSVNADIGERLNVSSNFTSLRSENAARGSANFGRMLARRPRETANVEATYRWPLGLQTTLAAQRVGHSFENPSNTLRLHAYTLVELRASFAVSDKLEVYGRIENLFDEDYETILSYGTTGRGAFIGARQTF